MSILIRDATADDIPALELVDSVAAGGDSDRPAMIRRWVRGGFARVAEENGAVLGYCVVDRTFFDEAFVIMMMVAQHARGRGIGGKLLVDAQQRCGSRKLFTSANLSNQPMQRLLAKLGWQSAGIVYGLDAGDPELIFMASADARW